MKKVLILAILFASIFGYLFFKVTVDSLQMRLLVGAFMAGSGAIVGAIIGGILNLICKIFK